MMDVTANTIERVERYIQHDGQHGRVAGLLLAAGAGRRLGGQPKALIELGGQTLADRGIALLREGGADPVLIVTGAAPISVATVHTVYNPEWRSGMGSSLAAGLRALEHRTAERPTDGQPTEIKAVVIALADQPFVGPEAVRRLIVAYHDGATVAVAAYDGQPRNPVLISRDHWLEVIDGAQGDTGARAFLRANPGLITPVECGDTGRPDDIDTPADLERARGTFTARYEEK